MTIALCAAFFVLGLVARDAIKAIWSLTVLKRMNRRFKRGGVNSPGPRGASRPVRPMRVRPAREIQSGEPLDPQV